MSKIKMNILQQFDMSIGSFDIRKKIIIIGLGHQF